MHRPKRWNLPDRHPGAEDLASRLKVSPLVAQVLLNRGIHQTEDCLAFLRPSLKLLHPPDQITNLTKAAARIARAIRDKEKIVIYGDYDVDGITATSILWHAITVYDGVVDFYVPHRIDEGYGLNAEAIGQLCDQGAKLIVTVDCGITAIEPARTARERGVDLIITDHHEWREQPAGEPISVGAAAASSPASLAMSSAAPSSVPDILLPDCYAVVHPRLPGDGLAYPNKHLCGAGVAFKLAWGIGQAMSGGSKVDDKFRAFLVDATALAALGTIADVVPLVGENRILAHFGLGGLKETRLRGLVALIESAGLSGQKLESYDVGFKLAPRLNACGRMGHARLAVEMLTRAGAEQSAEIATYLEGQNRKRQAMEKEIVEAAVQQVMDNGYDADDCYGIVLGAEGWHPGVIGIVASRIVDKFHRPTVMIGLNEGIGQGSGRSVPGFHLSRALDACQVHLSSWGGHEMAAGLKLKSENLASFREAFCHHAGQVMTPQMLIPELPLESLAELRQITAALVTDLHRLGPFGHANRKPLLCCRDLEISAPPRRVGKGSAHLQLRVRQGLQTMKCIAFGYGDMEDQLCSGTRIDMAVEAGINEFNGHSNVELQVKDLIVCQPVNERNVQKSR